MDNKRVACLYRVSTKAQVDKETNDIPMQQNACMDFIKTKPSWELVKEYTERGVSGFKKTANQRDVLQQIRSDAEGKAFDVLLVFMFDRLGRLEDETPFILEWFVNQGIEVWSVKEGQQKFENRADKLINYIRFWQSGGESEKTGIRVKEKHTQMIKGGQFCGGVAPYGYRLVWADKVNSKGRMLKKMVIDEGEAEVVRMVYRLATVEGYGGYRIACMLNDRGIPTRKSSKWGLTAVNYMLRNPIYKGYPAYGKTTAKSGKNKRLKPYDWIVSEVRVSELAIIDEGVWDKAQRIRRSRTPACYLPENTTPNYPKQTKSPLLFTGLIKCGYCGSTMCSYSSVAKWKTKDGEKRVSKSSYRCTSVNKGIKCEGQVTYVQNKIEEPVLEEICRYLDRLEKIDLGVKINQLLKNQLRDEEKAYKAIQKEIASSKKDLTKLNNEIAKALLGKSSFSPEQLSVAIDQKESEVKALFHKENELYEKLKRNPMEVNQAEAMQKLAPDWKAEFLKAGNNIKKMLIAEIIDNITVYKDRIEIDFRFTIEDFCKEC